MNEEELYKNGLAKHTEIFGEGVEEWRKKFRSISPDAVEYLMKYCFGAYYCRPGVDLKVRELCTVAALAVLARWPQLKSHVTGALRAGASKVEITEILLQMQNYGGWPIALTALETADEAFKDFEKESKAKPS